MAIWAVLVVMTAAVAASPSPFASSTAGRSTLLSCSAQSLPLAPLLRLRGGVHTLTSMEEWETMKAEAGDKLIVLDFTATWCGPCQAIAPVFTAMAEERPDVLFVKCDVDELAELAAAEGVSSMPTFLFFRNGESIATLRGADPEGLRALVEEHAAAEPVEA